ncbi:4-alpha-glucanotransferase [Sagittula sp. MA-2]|jgi:4-alpha-glucanotransferase|uniref:4-alpha-glucanotransferase n=1 Tax=Sagittula sp. MA-2 TaxID=3048007 RepID=UPI0024C40C27|nr:4-alpha-glucanotransferase [Sagittula sp. MA-2]WHZ35386.1 4-alpha-glucanotransferase [Sagittula sp. MA-2]
MTEALRALAEANGIHPGFHDLSGRYLTAAPETLTALLRATGTPVSSESEATEALTALRATEAARHLPAELLLTEGESHSLPVACEWTVADENGTERASGGPTEPIPPLPFGYYVLNGEGQGWTEEVFVLVRPASGAPSVADLAGVPRAWGVVGALYGFRSDRNGGLGSYADLAEAAEALAPMGSQFLGINPIHALGWAAVDMLSPYSPTHRGFLSTDHIAVPGLGPTPPAELIDYIAFRKQHRAGLEAAYAAFEGDPDFDAYLAAHPDLSDFAAYEALSEQFGEDSRTWPARLRKPGPEATKAARTRARFHAWAQWQAETQTKTAQRRAKAAGMGFGLYLDLAVGSRPGCAESWMNPETVATGVSIGAPPDYLNPEGQSWNLAVHAPKRLTANRYHPLRDMLHRLMSRAGILRIDHALGLLRAYWQPEDGSPGGYVTQPFDALLSVIAIEARRTGCLVIGEDLGLVPAGFRERMNAAGLLSYSVWQYETHDDGTLVPAADLRPHALACFGTHDTPTLRGFWYGTDIRWWQTMGWQSESETRARLDQRSSQRAGLREMCNIPFDAGPAQIARAIHGALLNGPSVLTALQLDDLLGQVEAQNLPGTIDQHPNWRRRLPVPVAELANAAQIRDTLPQRPESDSTPAAED